MTRNEALGIIVSNYLSTTGKTQSDLAKTGNITRSYINKIVLRKLTSKNGVSSTMFAKLSKAMDMQVQELEDLVNLCINNGGIKLNDFNNTKTINGVIDLLKSKRLSNEQLKQIYNYIYNI